MMWMMKTELPLEAREPWLVEDDGEVLLLSAGNEGNQIWSFESDNWNDLNRNLTVGREAGLFLTCVLQHSLVILLFCSLKFRITNEQMKINIYGYI